MSSKTCFPNSIEEEFSTVDLLLRSCAPTSRIDAFIIAWVKSERQIRKIFSYIVYQYPMFPENNGSEISKILGRYRNLYSDNFIKGFNKIYPKKFKDIFGDQYDDLYVLRKQQQKIRNKVMHGQLSGSNLSKDDLSDEIQAIRNWCEKVAASMENEIGYDGFIRNSLQKSEGNIASKYKININDLNQLREFIEGLQ